MKEDSILSHEKVAMQGFDLLSQRLNQGSRCRSLFKGLSWGAAVLILAAAGWAIIQNLGYAPLIKVGLLHGLPAVKDVSQEMR